MTTLHYYEYALGPILKNPDQYFGLDNQPGPM